MALLVVACSASNRAEEEADESVSNSKGRFLDLEFRLLEAASGRVSYQVSATGAVEVNLDGELFWQPGNRLRIESAGSFAGTDLSMLLVSDGINMRLVTNGSVEEIPTPTHLNEAALLGLTRMGILHNLARLTGGAPPDHADGLLREWLDVDSVIASEGPEGSLFSFAIVVDGQKTANAELVLEENSLPVVRTQTVVFPEGTMHVEESYTLFELGVAIDSTVFFLR